MKAVLTEGIGGYDKLNYTEVETPKISKNEVLLKVLAAGINNTDINTRIGWYSSKINADTDALSKSKFQNSNQKNHESSKYQLRNNASSRSNPYNRKV